MNRKATPDILGALMGGAINQENQGAVEKVSNKASEPDSKETINRANNKAVNVVPPSQTHFNGMEPVAEELVDLPIQKEKATFNLSKSMLGDLEDMWIEIRKLRGDKKISKTDIVEQAIEEVVKDFKLKKKLSKFYSKLESNKASKQ